MSVVDVVTGRDVDRITLPYAARAPAWGPGGRLVIACRRDLYCAEVAQAR
ncbi:MULTISPECIES: hypothetical protein [Actinoplanes]|nr:MULTISPECIES: hypothetical protein [Actinoplanes]GLY03808.1 hypothetical protein Acsp01_41870 [Actinoplanes sp. NBRC 101535]